MIYGEVEANDAVIVWRHLSNGVNTFAEGIYLYDTKGAHVYKDAHPPYNEHSISREAGGVTRGGRKLLLVMRNMESNRREIAEKMQGDVADMFRTWNIDY